MTQVISSRGFVANLWPDTPLPTLEDYTGGPALLLQPGEDPGEAAAHFGTLDLIVIPFEISADGRGFSLARVLRGLGFQGHLRAQGHILVDQFRAALRSGFTDVEISDAQAKRNPETQWMTVPLDAGYQPRVLAV